MSTLTDLFDTYGRNARLYPAILVMVPILALPGVFGTIQAVSSFAVATLFGVAALYALTHVVRALGKRAEIRLLVRWDGLPSTRWLLWSDPTLDATTKHRYHEFLRSKGLAMPSVEEERADLDGARERLASAVNWLRNNRRGDAHKILLGENASYGFRRNLYGSKTLGIFISLVCMVISGGMGARAMLHTSAPTIEDALKVVTPEVRIGFVVALAWFCGWLFVRPGWVRDAGELYAKALLETCDSP